MCPEEYTEIWLCCVVTENAVRRRLVKAFGTPAAVYGASGEELRELGELTEEAVKKLVSSRNAGFLDRTLAKLDRNGIRFLWHDNPEFPKRLTQIPDAPMGLFLQGTLPPAETPAIAIVGTRQSTPYGEFVAKQFGHGLADSGVPVVSGLAMGIDAAAHRGCVDAGGIPIAVLGSGIGTPYPRENTILYRHVTDRGCVISEYGPGVPALSHHFPHRNRLISGLSDGVVVVEAKAKSGTLITVDRALEQGKSVYVIPGRVTDQNSIGCNQLIREGAQLVTNPGEVLADLSAQNGVPLLTETEDGRYCFAAGTARKKPSDKITKKSLASNEKIVYAFLRLSPKHFDQLVWESGLTPSELTNVLNSLEREGWITRISAGCYCVTDSDTQ